MESKKYSILDPGSSLWSGKAHDPPQHPEEDLYNSHMEFIDGELTLYDENGHVIHIFERENLPRTAYKYMTRKIQNNFDSELTPEENWAKAEKSWTNLSPELQAQLFLLNNSEERNFKDIRQGLLATLSNYQGLSSIKKLFSDAITCVTIDD